MKNKRRNEFLKQFSGATVLRGRELALRGFNRAYVNYAYKTGVVERVGHGLYRLPDANVSEAHTLVQVVEKYPKAIICLLSALSFHEITTQIPSQVWIALGARDWQPKTDQIKLFVVRFSGTGLTAGVEEHLIEGKHVRITSVARTVVDLFKYRNKVGIDIALEALREAWRERRVTMDEVTKLAKIRGVATVMKPYLESIL